MALFVNSIMSASELISRAVNTLTVQGYEAPGCGPLGESKFYTLGKNCKNIAFGLQGIVTLSAPATSARRVTKKRGEQCTLTVYADADCTGRNEAVLITGQADCEDFKNKNVVGGIAEARSAKLLYCI